MRWCHVVTVAGVLAGVWGAGVVTNELGGSVHAASWRPVVVGTGATAVTAPVATVQAATVAAVPAATVPAATVPAAVVTPPVAGALTWPGYVSYPLSVYYVPPLVQAAPVVYTPSYAYAAPTDLAQAAAALPLAVYGPVVGTYYRYYGPPFGSGFVVSFSP